MKICYLELRPCAGRTTCRDRCKLSALGPATEHARHGTCPAVDCASHSYRSHGRRSWYTWFPVYRASLVDKCFLAMSWHRRESPTSHCSRRTSGSSCQLQQPSSLFYSVLQLYVIEWFKRITNDASVLYLMSRRKTFCSVMPAYLQVPFWRNSPKSRTP